MKLTKTQAQELLDSGTDTELGLTTESDEQMDSRRWVSVHRLIVRDNDGRFWETCYEQGLTEYQDIQPFEDEEDIEFHEVEKVPVTSYTYRKI